MLLGIKILFFNTKKYRKKDFLIGYRYYWKQIYESRDIFPLKEIEFGGYKFPSPNNSDAILKELYGNIYGITTRRSKSMACFLY